MISAKPTVYTVSELNNYVKGVLDSDAHLKQLFLTGEISNFKAHYSGHYYMTVKDETAAIKAVMFAGNAKRLRFIPENGMKVLILGTVSLFPRDGSYQLYITDMQPDGVGALGIAFEQLKNKLASEGLFAQEHKKPLPAFPRRIGVVTSPTGAAVRDIFNVLARRFPSAEVIIRPCKVQGEGAAADIAKAVEVFNRFKAADVLIVGRGGGSVEDLWAFNEEVVARAVYNSEIPVISAVGHETDFTICDFVADLRAPTPSAAAECAVPDTSELQLHLFSLKQRIVSSAKNAVDMQRAKLSAVENNPVFKDPISKINDNRAELIYLGEKLSAFVKESIDSDKAVLGTLAGKLQALSPLGVISRGYSLTQKGSEIVTDINSVNIGDEVCVKVSGGTFKATVTDVFKE